MVAVLGNIVNHKLSNIIVHDVLGDICSFHFFRFTLWRVYINRRRKRTKSNVITRHFNDCHNALYTRLDPIPGIYHQCKKHPKRQEFIWTKL